MLAAQIDGCRIRVCDLAKPSHVTPQSMCKPHYAGETRLDMMIVAPCEQPLDILGSTTIRDRSQSVSGRRHPFHLVKLVNPHERAWWSE